MMMTIRTIPRTIPILVRHQRRLIYSSFRAFSLSRAHLIEPPSYLNDSERSIFDKLSTSLSPTKLDVQDISGGCGSMYGLEIESAKFQGLSVIKQHKMVNEVLKEEVKGWHGVQIKTRVPEAEG